MRKIASWLVSIVLGCILSNVALANTFAGGIPKEVPYTYEGITYDRYLVFSRSTYDGCTNTHAIYFVSSEMEAVGHPLGYHYSLVRNGNTPLIVTGPNGTHTAIFSAADNFQGTCVWLPDSIPETTVGMNAWNLRSDQPEAIHDHNFDLYTRSAPDHFLPYTFTEDYASYETWYEGKYQGDSSFGFSVPKDKNGNPFTPYTAEVSSVMDHDTLGKGAIYAAGRNGSVSLFNGEKGNVTAGCYCYSTGTSCDAGNYQNCEVPGYLKKGGGNWTFTDTINYSGSYVYYDAHPGYDYPFAKGTPIHAATAGTLCVATNKTAYDGTLLWRDPSHCPFAKAGGTNWGSYHTFYIIHEGLLFNGSVDSYMTVYLHSNNLEPSIEGIVLNNGYAMVTDGQYVADVGKMGTTGNHLHFEMYKWNASASRWDRIDPYGDGVNNILWRR